MGDVFRYHSKKQLETLDNIEMLRLLYLFEIVTFVRNLDETALLDPSIDLLKDVPLVTEDHYKYIVTHLMLPEEVLGDTQ